MSSFVEKKNKKGGKVFPLTAQDRQLPRLVFYESGYNTVLCNLVGTVRVTKPA